MDDKRKKLMGMIGGKVKGVLGAPGSLVGDLMLKMADAKGRRADREVSILKNARNSKGAPQFDMKGNPTDAFKYQVAADAIRDKYKK